MVVVVEREENNGWLRIRIAFLGVSWLRACGLGNKNVNVRCPKYE